MRFWPRQLRWRLVLGFALIVALLQVGLTGTERFLLEGALRQSIQQNLRDTVTTGLAAQVPISQKQSVVDYLATILSSAGSANRTVRGKSRALRFDKQIAQVKSDFAMLSKALNTTDSLGALAHALALPDQPVAMLDSYGRVLVRTGSLSQDRTRKQKLAPGVLAGLLHAAIPRAATIAQPWVSSVPTPDGAYLLVLWPTKIDVLTQSDSDQLNMLLKIGPTALSNSDVKATIRHIERTHLVVMIARRLGETEQTIQTFTAISMGGALMVILIAGALSLLVVSRSLRPLSAISRGAERLAQGDYRYRIALDPSTTADEVGRLAAAFDHMAEAIGSAFATQRRFVADASHELRTPLTTLRGYTDVLLMGVDDDRATADRVLQAMQEDLGRMSRLVNDLLTLARIDGGASLHLETLNIGELLHTAAQEARIVSRGTHIIVVEAIPAEICVLGDRDRWRQVLSNIAGNACLYCPPGSTIILGAASESNAWGFITVCDNGPGIPPRDLARLGERFYRGDSARSRSTGGTGLGLAIARSIVEAHGGTLTISSTMSQGTTVEIRVPLLLAAATTPHIPALLSPH